MTIEAISTRYGRKAFEHLHTVLSRAKSADPLAPVVLIVPNNITGIVARRYLAAGVNEHRGIAGVDITTMGRLATRLAASTMAPRLPLTPTVLAAAWRRELADKPLGFSPVADHPGTVRALADAHRALRDLTDDALEIVADSTGISRDVVELHRRVCARLSDGWYDRTELLHAAAAMASDLPSTVLFLPQDLDRAERAFIRAVPRLAVVAGCTGVPTADRGVLRGLATPGNVPPGHRAAANGPHVVSASDSDEEARVVIRDLMVTLAVTPAHRVAILYTAASPYARILAEQLALAGVTINGPSARPVSEHAAPRLLSGLLALPDGDLSCSALFEALAEAPTRDFAGDPIPVAAWERVARAAGVVRGRDWQLRLSEHAAQLRARAAHHGAAGAVCTGAAQRHLPEAAIADALRGFVATLGEHLDEATRLLTWGRLAAWAVALFDSILDDSRVFFPVEEQHAAETVRSILQELAGLDGIEPVASFAALRDVLRAELGVRNGRTGRFGEGVFVAPLSAAVGLDLDKVYVVGACEDLLPGIPEPDGLLPDSARSAANGQLPARQDHADRHHRHLLAALASAATAVVTYPRGDLRRSVTRRSSRFLQPLGTATDQASAEVATEVAGSIHHSPSFAGALMTTIEPATEQEWRIRAAAYNSDIRDDVVQAAVTLRKARASKRFTRFDGNLTGSTGLPNFADGRLLVSPTTLEQYATCPHAFFVARLLGVEPLRQPEELVAVSPVDIGNLVHESIDQFISHQSSCLPRAGAPWTTSQRRRLRRIASERADELQRRGVTGHPRLWRRERARILTQVDAMIGDENTWRSARGTSVVCSEMPFGTNGADPVRIRIPSGTVTMRGSADRVDRDADGTLWVTDIKTGNAKSYRGIGRQNPTLGGTKLQLPAYAYAAKAHYGKTTGSVETQYWFIRRDAPTTRVTLRLDQNVETIYKQTLDVLVRSIATGLFPGKPPAAVGQGSTRCTHCDPGVATTANRQRWERKRDDPQLLELAALVDPRRETRERQAHA